MFRVDLKCKKSDDSEFMQVFTIVSKPTELLGKVIINRNAKNETMIKVDIETFNP